MGEYDEALHVSATEKFRAHIKKGRVAIIKDRSHVPSMDKPSKTRDLYRKFLKEARKSEKKDGTDDG